MRNSNRLTIQNMAVNPMHIFIDGKQMTIESGTTLLQLAEQLQPEYPYPILGAALNNKLYGMHDRPQEGDRVSFFDVTSATGNRIYQLSLTFVLIKAVRELYSDDAELSVEHSLSTGLYCELKMPIPLDEAEVKRIRHRMAEIIDEDLPFDYEPLPKKEAMEFFRREHLWERVRLLSYRPAKIVHVYRLGWLHEYFYSPMVPSTAYLKLFDLTFYEPGFLLRFPTQTSPDAIPDYNPSPKLFSIYREAEEWASILRVRNVPDLNDVIMSGSSIELMQTAEALHEKKIGQIADQIAAKKARLIMIAAPSSSGKTTFANRLAIQLRVNGLRPVTIGLDDYYLDRGQIDLGPDGKPDLESLYALDVERFNHDFALLLKGEQVELPIFDFTTGKRSPEGRMLALSEGQPIIIEGIHGLNPQLSHAIPEELKFRIYLSTLTQLNLDRHNRIPTTDARIVRRLVRDSQFRGYPADDTLHIWPSVRRGEEKWIFPYYEEADAIFNSHLIYELAALKPFAEPLLEEIGRDHPYFMDADRLLKLLSYFRAIDIDHIPANSILREFVGGSIFGK